MRMISRDFLDLDSSAERSTGVEFRCVDSPPRIALRQQVQSASFACDLFQDILSAVLVRQTNRKNRLT